MQELAKTSHGFICSKCFMWWAGFGHNRLISDCISGCRKAISIGKKLAEEEPLGLKYTQLILFPYNHTLPENYMRLLAPHENTCMHPSKISTYLATNFKNRHRCLISWIFYSIHVNKPEIPQVAEKHSDSRILQCHEHNRWNINSHINSQCFNIHRGIFSSSSQAPAVMLVIIQAVINFTLRSMDQS